VHDGGYTVTSEILSFLSPAHLPVQITPTRWTRDPESLIKFMRDRFERSQEQTQEERAASHVTINHLCLDNKRLLEKIRDLEPDADY